MRKYDSSFWCLMSVLLLISTLLFSFIDGCSTVTARWKDNPAQLRSDAFMFSKLATRVSLAEANSTSADAAVIRQYLVALKDLLTVPGHPDFTGARSLVTASLPQKYQVYGYTIIDVIDRYVQTANLSVTNDQKLLISVVSSAIDGAIAAVEELPAN